MKKTILALQIGTNLDDFNKNFETVERLYKPCDILFLPEVWSMGWCCEDFVSKSEQYGDITLNFLKDFAKKNNVNIVGGSYIRKTQDGLKNSTPIISRNGDIIDFYDKTHLYTPDGEGCITSGNAPKMVDIEGLKIGLSICYDIRFPEFYRSFDDMPELLVNLSAWPKTRAHHYYHLCHARAIENQAYFLGLSQMGEIKNGVYNAGSSLLVNPFGETLQRLGEGEEFILAEIDSDVTKKLREDYPNLKMRKKVNVYENA